MSGSAVDRGIPGHLGTRPAAPRGQRGHRRGDDRRRVPLLRRLPDDAVHRGPRAHGPLAPLGRRGLHERRERARSGGHGLGRGRHRARRAATGSTGQGLSLMQESLAEITLARLPLVVLDMSRAQGDYFQATRGGGHGDYRHLVLAPADAGEAVELVGTAFELTERWRNPVVVMGDYYLAHTARSVDACRAARSARTPRVGPRRHLGRHRPGQAGLLPRHGEAAPRRRVRPGHPLRGVRGGHRSRWSPASSRSPRWPAPRTPRWSSSPSAHRRPTCGRAVKELRSRGIAAGYVRPITLFPFPSEVVARAAASGAKSVAVYENNQGQMVDDVRLAVLDRAPVHFIGGLSLDSSGFGIAPDLDVEVLGLTDRGHVGELRPDRPTARGSGPPGRRLHAVAHRRGRAPPLPRLWRAGGDAVRGRSGRRARSHRPARSPCSASAATPPSPTTSTSRCSRRCTAGRPPSPPG